MELYIGWIINNPFFPDQKNKQTKKKRKEIEGCSYGDEDGYVKNKKKSTDSQDKQEGNQKLTFSCLESNCLFLSIKRPLSPLKTWLRYDGKNPLQFVFDCVGHAWREAEIIKKKKKYNDPGNQSTRLKWIHTSRIRPVDKILGNRLSITSSSLRPEKRVSFLVNYGRRGSRWWGEVERLVATPPSSRPPCYRLWRYDELIR